MKFYYHIAVLFGLLIGTHTQFANSRKLQPCSFYQNVTLTEKTFCKNSTVYPLAIITLPYIYVTEILDFNEEEHSITISLQMMLKWNDSAIISTGPKTREKYEKIREMKLVTKTILPNFITQMINISFFIAIG